MSLNFCSSRRTRLVRRGEVIFLNSLLLNNVVVLIGSKSLRIKFYGVEIAVPTSSQICIYWRIIFINCTSMPKEHMMEGTVITPALMMSMGAPSGVKDPSVFSINVSTWRPVTESMMELRDLATAANPADIVAIHHHPTRNAGNSPTWWNIQVKRSPLQCPCWPSKSV